MKPTDLRNAQWHEVLTHVTDDMVKVHGAWLRFGKAGTTREVAQASGISVFTFRPRTTDLYKLGLVELDGKRGNEGLYVYRTAEQAHASRAWQQRADGRGSEPAPGPERACPERVERVGFVTVEEAIASLSPADRRALGARLMGESAHGRHRPEPQSTAQLDLLPA
jgi:hypothetical protein